jgi:hypothetical protein
VHVDLLIELFAWSRGRRGSGSRLADELAAAGLGEFLEEVDDVRGTTCSIWSMQTPVMA